jgi:hypothetical protein
MSLIATEKVCSAIEVEASQRLRRLGLPKRERLAEQRVAALVGTKRPADSAAAVEPLLDLRSGSERTGRGHRVRATHHRATRGAPKDTESAGAAQEGPSVIVATARFPLPDNLPGIRTR